MRRITFLLIGLFFTATLQAQGFEGDYLTGKLVSGYPREVSTMVKGLSQIKSATLETGIDSMKVYFGSFLETNGRGYWTALYHDKGSSFQSVELEPKDSLGMLAADLEFNLNQGSMTVSLKILYNPITDEIFYQWVNKNGISKVASLQEVNRSINKGEPMPHFIVEGLTGTSFTLDDFKNKYLIINWWQMACRPCIAEMPGLNKLVEKYKSRKDVAFIAIADDGREKLEKFLSTREFKYQQALSNTEVAALFGKSYPKHIIVNPQGVVTFYLEGGSAEIHNYIEESLKNQLEKD